MRAARPCFIKGRAPGGLNKERNSGIFGSFTEAKISNGISK